MIIIDHVIDRIDTDIEVDFKYFLEEWKSGKYNKFLECPSYSGLKALIDASNILRKHIGWETLSIKKMLSDLED